MQLSSTELFDVFDLLHTSTSYPLRNTCSDPSAPPGCSGVSGPGKSLHHGRSPYFRLARLSTWGEILLLSSRICPRVIGADCSSCFHFLAESMAACTPTLGEHFLQGRTAAAELSQRTTSEDEDEAAPANTSNAVGRSAHASLA